MKDEDFKRGQAVKSEVLGEKKAAELDSTTSELDREFREMMTRHAWGEIWGRPGLERGTRSLVTLAVLATRGCWDEFAEHLRAARNNGVTPETIKELLLHISIYAGVPIAWRAFSIAKEVLAEKDG